MHRFYLSPDECEGNTLRLKGGEAHHAIDVLRIRNGEQVLVLDGAGTELLCEVQNAQASDLRLTVASKKQIPPLPCQITLLQAVPKGKIIDSIIQKATELGAARIIPLLSERVATRLDDESRAQKAEKWQMVAIEAIKQCGSAWLPKVEPPVTPGNFLARKEKFDLSLIASLQPGAGHARDCFEAFRQENRRMPATISIWVGPEGDFTPAEVESAQASGARPITLGRLVLRSETAATYCLSIVNHELQKAPTEST